MMGVRVDLCWELVNDLCVMFVLNSVVKVLIVCICCFFFKDTATTEIYTE